MFKMRCGIPNAYILNKTMYKMHVLLSSYYTIRLLISKTLTGTCEGSVFLEGPEDDSIRIETCHPNTIINIMKFCCV